MAKVTINYSDHCHEDPMAIAYEMGKFVQSLIYHAKFTQLS
ncbi:hypothetical protein [Flavobacterium enshiense]|nr:hypothetical protein [Flavobacterium enshiense]